MHGGSDGGNARRTVDNEPSQWHVCVHDGGLNIRGLVIDLHVITGLVVGNDGANALDDLLGEVRIGDVVVREESGLATQVCGTELVVLAGAAVLKANTIGSKREQEMSVTLVLGHNFCEESGKLVSGVGKTRAMEVCLRVWDAYRERDRPSASWDGFRMTEC